MRINYKISSLKKALTPVFEKLKRKCFIASIVLLYGATSFGQNISTVVGNGTAGYSGDGSLSTSAKITKPYDVALDASGNIYVADANNNVIRKVTKSTGMISTIAGTGTAAYSGDGGLAISAELNFPEGITVDGVGNLYIADTRNQVVRKVDAITGIITTVAGNGVFGYAGDGGSAIAAEIHNPIDVAVDAAGNLYICDNGNFVIRKVAITTGFISTYAGTGTSAYSGNNVSATSASFVNPFHICLDISGNLFVADNGSCSVIRKINAITGVMITVVGKGVSGFGADGLSALNAYLNNPTGVSVDNVGNIYISDYLNNRIRLVDVKTGWIKTVAGNGYAGYSGDGSGAQGAMINSPMAVVVDNSNNVVFADLNNNVVRRFNSSTMLPLLLVDFAGSVLQTNNLLVWKTTNEVGTKDFQIEASTNALDFATVGIIEAKGGGDYTFTDSKPIAQRIFYRLKMNDLDGNFTYSPVIALIGKNTSTDDIKVFPNPVINTATINLGNNPSLLNSEGLLFDNNGKLMTRITFISNYNILDLGKCPSGIYYLKLLSGQNIKIIKQ